MTLLYYTLAYFAILILPNSLNVTTRFLLDSHVIRSQIIKLLHLIRGLIFQISVLI